MVIDVAKELNASVESIQTAPDFRRFLMQRNDEAIVVDLVHEYVFQIQTEKSIINGVRIDSPEEIMANKLLRVAFAFGNPRSRRYPRTRTCGFEFGKRIESGSEKRFGFDAGTTGLDLESDRNRRRFHLARRSFRFGTERLSGRVD